MIPLSGGLVGFLVADDLVAPHFEDQHASPAAQRARFEIGELEVAERIVELSELQDQRVLAPLAEPEELRLSGLDPRWPRAARAGRNDEVGNWSIPLVD